jgi:hypothetical protein
MIYRGTWVATAQIWGRKEGPSISVTKPAAGQTRFLPLNLRAFHPFQRSCLVRLFFLLQVEENAAYFCLSFARLSLAWLFALGRVLT